jgi:ABC-type uncharacterized transport system substrate-binding protein
VLWGPNLLHASSDSDLDGALTTAARLRAAGLVVGPDTLFNSRVDQLAALSVRHALPTVYQWREFVAAGGLLSYGGSISDAFRLGGVYTGRILNGDKPTDLPVQQTTKIELFINLNTAKALGGMFSSRVTLIKLPRRRNVNRRALRETEARVKSRCRPVRQKHREELD